MKLPWMLIFAFPMTALASDILLASNINGNIPSDFRNYFYRSELMAQVVLNDRILLDAVLSLHENGNVYLVRVTEDAEGVNKEISHRWASILREGVSIGKCTQHCPSGLRAVEYQLDSSTLKIYTEQYETAQAKSNYITMPDAPPGGVIMLNDLFAVSASSSKNWNLNSSLLSSLGSWTQKASLQAYGSSGPYAYNSTNIYELHTQKELAGHFLRLGLFSPDSDSGNVQSSPFGFGSVMGAMWGTSDALLSDTDSVSATPVYVTGRSQSIAEVWRDGRMIYNQQLQPGLQPIDTRRLPSGIYDVTINIIENGKVVDTQLAQIYKPQGWNNPDNRWRMNLWAGEKRTIGSDSDSEGSPFFWGGGVEYLLHPRAILGVNATVKEKEYQIRTRMNFTLSPNDSLFAQYTFGDDSYQKNKISDIRYYHNLSPGSSMNLFWRLSTTDIYRYSSYSRRDSNTWGASLSLQLPRSSALIFSGQYMDMTDRSGFSSDASLTTSLTLAGRDINVRGSAYDRPGFNQHHRDQGVEVGFSISLAPTAQHRFAVDLGVSNQQEYSRLDYQWQPNGNGPVRWLGGSLSSTVKNTTFSGNGELNGRYLGGDFYAQHGTHDNTNTAGVNLSQALIIGGGKIAAGSGQQYRGMQSAFIVDVESDEPDMGITATDSLTEATLFSGRNIVPASMWKKDMVQFSSNGDQNVQLIPALQQTQMIPGSVQYISLKAVKTTVMVGMLQDPQGRVLKNRQVSSDVANGVVNADGVLTLDSGVNNHQLTVQANESQPALRCAIPPTLDNKKVHFYSVIHCQSSGEK